MGGISDEGGRMALVSDWGLTFPPTERTDKGRRPPGIQLPRT